MATLKMKHDDYALTQERIEKSKLESRARRARRIEVATRLSKLRKEINKVRPQLIRKGINPDDIRTINQLKRIMDNINGRNRFRDLIPETIREFGVTRRQIYPNLRSPLRIYRERWGNEARNHSLYANRNIRSETFPTTAQIEEAIVAKLNSHWTK